MYYLYKIGFSIPFFSILVASFGSIFIVLKYKLDQANYHKSLFEERYTIFCKIQELILSVLKTEDQKGNENKKQRNWQYFSEELDLIYRKSYFLFSKSTYQFIDKVRSAIIDVSFYKDQVILNEEAKDRKIKAEEFLRQLLEQQNLSENFPELKIDSY